MEEEEDPYVQEEVMEDREGGEDPGTETSESKYCLSPLQDSFWTQYESYSRVGREGLESARIGDYQVL